MKGVSFMADVTIKVRDNGPYLVSGNVELVDAEGNPTINRFVTARIEGILKVAFAPNK